MTTHDRRTFLQAVGTTGAVLTGGVAAAGARKGARGDTTIVDLAVDAEGFDVLVAAVAEAGLVDTLSGNRQLTVFAPTDAAFEALGITADTVGDPGEEFLVDVLTYHVTPGRRYADSIVNAPRFSTLNGADVTVDGTTLNGGQADIVATDLEASNGVVHVIDGVLLP
ncbi:fasciclin domain-containing protein [Halobacteriales archaeon Cl-PHB]